VKQWGLNKPFFQANPNLLYFHNFTTELTTYRQNLAHLQYFSLKLDNSR